MESLWSSDLDDNMAKIGTPFTEEKSSGMIRIPVADTLGQEPAERKKKKRGGKKKSPLSLMNDNKQCHLVAIYDYLG